MGDIYFSNNPAEWGQLEGLYVAERDPPGYIRGADLFTIGILGRCVRGPITPQLITSMGRFAEVYGEGYFAGNLVGEVWKALVQKRFGAVVVQRVCAAAAAAATVNLDDTAGVGGTNIVTITANWLGASGNGAAGGLTVSVEAATDGVSTHWNLRATFAGKDQLWENLNTGTGANNLATVMGDDLANFITVTKLADGRPHNQAATALASGSDGTVAASDYTTALASMAAYDGVSVVICPESLETVITGGAQATFNAAVVTQAALVVDRIFLTWSGILGNSVANEITAVGAQITTRSDRIVWCFNAARMLDPVTATLVATGPHVWLASILSQIDVDIHAGSAETTRYLAGIKSLYNEALSRADLKALRNAGISTLEKLRTGMQYRSAVVTDLTTGKTELSRRRMTDYLQLSASERLRYYVKAQGTPENRAQMVGELTTYSKGLKKARRIIQDFEIKSDEVNSEENRSEGEENILWRVDFIPHMLSVILQTEMGTGVTIEVQEA